MDILITKDHMQGSVWVFEGDTQRNVAPIRAADMFRNGLARPLVVLMRRTPTPAPAAADIEQAKATPVKATGQSRKKDVQTSAQTFVPPPAVETATTADGDSGQPSASEGGDADDAVQTSAQNDPNADANGGDGGDGGH